MIKIAAISGSTRTLSSNIAVIKAIQKLFENKINIQIFNNLEEIPTFNPDKDGERVNEKVSSFRNFLNQSDGILICTPEYAMGVPGALKNAIDWCVSSCEFYKKPVALITASSIGTKGHASLMETLKIIDSQITTDTELIISSIKTKINTEKDEFTDIKTQEEVIHLINSLIALIQQNNAI